MLKIEDFINDKRLTVQLVCSFRYGREVSSPDSRDQSDSPLLQDEETMGLNFKKELVVDEAQLFPSTERVPASPTRLQDRVETSHWSRSIQILRSDWMRS